MQIDCNVVLDHERLKIVNISAKSFGESGLAAMQWPTPVVWLVTLEWYLPDARKYIEQLPGAIARMAPGNSVCILINQPEEAEIASGLAGARVAWVNHNAFISPRIFSITGDEKIYDAVVNSSPLAWKRVHLCARIENLCCIRRVVEAGTPNLFDAATLSPRYVNDTKLGKPQVAALINKAFCGVILSAGEGACLASTEYLLCGLPVVSTPSVGGRHVWYDEMNSIIVEPDENSVRDGVAEAKRRVLAGEISATAIRENALKLRDRFSRNAETLIAGVLDEHGVHDVSAAEVMRGWLAEMDLASHQFKYLGSEDAAQAYVLSGNLAYWRNAVRGLKRARA